MRESRARDRHAENGRNAGSDLRRACQRKRVHRRRHERARYDYERQAAPNRREPSVDMGDQRPADNDDRREQQRHMRRDNLSLDARYELDGVVGRPHRSERYRPAMPHQRHRRCPRGTEAEHDQKRCGDGDRHPETGDPLNEAGEPPRYQQRLHQAVAGEHRHRAPDRFDALQLVHHVEHVDSRPHDAQDENGKAEALGARDGHVIELSAEDQQRERGCQNPRSSACAWSAPVQPDNREDKQGDRRRGQQPGGGSEVRANHRRTTPSIACRLHRDNVPVAPHVGGSLTSCPCVDVWGSVRSRAVGGLAIPNATCPTLQPPNQRQLPITP